MSRHGCGNKTKRDVMSDCACRRDHEHKHEAWCYQNGGRCQQCREWRAGRYADMSQYARKERILKGVDVMTPVGPASRMLQALARNGWGAGDLAPMLGKHYRPVTKIRAAERDFVLSSTDRAIRAVYQELEMRMNTTREGKITATRARNNGWLAPLDWDDIEAGVKG